MNLLLCIAFSLTGQMWQPFRWSEKSQLICIHIVDMIMDSFHWLILIDYSIIEIKCYHWLPIKFNYVVEKERVHFYSNIKARCDATTSSCHVATMMKNPWNTLLIYFPAGREQIVRGPCPLLQLFNNYLKFSKIKSRACPSERVLIVLLEAKSEAKVDVARCTQWIITFSSDILIITPLIIH